MPPERSICHQPTTDCSILHPPQFPPATARTVRPGSPTAYSPNNLFASKRLLPDNSKSSLPYSFQIMDTAPILAPSPSQAFLRFQPSHAEPYFLLPCPVLGPVPPEPDHGRAHQT